jgi:hypothetical protein
MDDDTWATLRATSLAVDLIAGYAFRDTKDSPGDGSLFGLALTYRFDKIAEIPRGWPN